MRILSTVDRPFADEHVIGTDPPMKPELPGVWRRRINPFTGRALSDRAMTAEQDYRAGMQRLRGQSVTPGILSGLDALFDPDAIGKAPNAASFQLLAGSGLTHDGEDVGIASPRRLTLAHLPVHARADQLAAIAADKAPVGTGDGAATGMASEVVTGTGALHLLSPALPRRTGPLFGKALKKDAAADLPRVAILVAEPVVATILGRPGDTCPRDPRDDPYDDLQRIDGCRLALFFWPSEMVARDGKSPDYSMPGAGADRRNRLAWRVFSIERNMAPDEMHPWERLGVPLALIGFREDWTLDFVDRSSVARMGGRPMPRTRLVPQSGSPILWQARVSQFVEQVADLADMAPATLAATLRQLPPVGFLPSDVFDIGTRRQSFFPAGFDLSAAPIPLEQLDLAIAESASLLPINLDVPDSVELLVPVPERVYEPGLLEVATIDPAFRTAITRYVADRTDWLVRREMIRRRRDLLIDAATGTRPTWPAGDLPDTEVVPYPATRAPVTAARVRRVTANGLRTLRLLDAGSSLAIAPGDTVYVWVRIVDRGSLTGLSVRFGSGTGLNAGDFSAGVYWGSPAALPLAAGDPAIALRSQGPLPDTGWTRLSIAGAARWKAGGGTLVDTVIDGLELSQDGGTVEWGPVGRIDAGGAETIWIGDDVPPGSLLSDSQSPNGQSWPQQPTGSELPTAEPDFGTAESNGARVSVAVKALHARWSQTFLAADFADIAEAGIDGFVMALEAKLKATNDAIDMGFVRAQSDIYRVRQYMLGNDAASRLVTSPSLADIATRDEGARAKSADLSAFFKTAYETDFNRDPTDPLATKPAPREATNTTAAAAAATSANTKTRASLLLAGKSFNPFSSITAVNRITEVATVRIPAPVAQPTILLTPVALGLGGTSGGAATANATLGASSLSALNLAANYSRNFNFKDVQGSIVLPGVVERTSSIAERLKPPPAVEAQQYAKEGKLAILKAIGGLIGDPGSGVRPLGIALGDLPAPGYERKQPPPAGQTAPPITLADVIADSMKDDDTQQFRDIDDVKADARHEADYFTAASKALDNGIAILRLVEGRVAFYNRLVADARAVRADLMASVAAADARLRVIAVELEEARHDFGTATVLLAEEQARVDALNARRAAVLAANADTIVFRRTRRSRAVDTLPTSEATALLDISPVVACTAAHDDVPEEIRDYVRIFRNAPIKWFPALLPKLKLIDRLDAVRASLVAVRVRATEPTTVAPISGTTMKLLAAVRTATAAQAAVTERRKVTAVQLDAGAIMIADLATGHAALAETASLADLIAGEHNRPQLSQQTAAIVDQIMQVAGCLHASFADVLPAVRLRWAETLSEFDRPAPLDALSTLAGWNQLDLETRRTQQGLVDYLYGQIDKTIADAKGAMDELVRVCLLMAAQSPVDRILPARLVAAVPARVGVRLDLAVDAKAARIGMVALVRDAAQTVIARAEVNDLGDGIARAQVTHVFGAAPSLAAGIRVELSALAR